MAAVPPHPLGGAGPGRTHCEQKEMQDAVTAQGCSPIQLMKSEIKDRTGCHHRPVATGPLVCRNLPPILLKTCAHKFFNKPSIIGDAARMSALLRNQKTTETSGSAPTTRGQVSKVLEAVQKMAGFGSCRHEVRSVCANGGIGSHRSAEDDAISP